MSGVENKFMQYPKIDVKELRSTTDKAIENALEEARKETKRQKEKEERLAKENQLTAYNIIEKIPSKCQSLAEEGKSNLVVMKLSTNRDIRFGKSLQINNPRDRQSLVGVGAIVWDYLVSQNLNPTIEYWHDGMGSNSGFQIEITW